MNNICVENGLSIETYFKEFNSTLLAVINDPVIRQQLFKSIEKVKSIKQDNQKILLIGNGGSAAIAEHMAIDFTKNAGVRAMTMSGTPQLTTFANDYGYEHIYDRGIMAYAQKGDMLIAISSGGESQNILNAVDVAKKMGCTVITLSAFKPDNSLRQRGHLNIYVNSCAYGHVEIIHNLLIHYINDAIIGRAVYKF